MKVSKTTLTQTARRDAIKHVFALVKNGASITNARQIVAEELNVKPNTLWLWQSKLNMRTPNVTKITSVTSRVNDNHVLTHSKEYSFHDISNDARKVMRSIVNKDGRYTVKEANVVGKFMSNEISKAKLQLEVHKHNTKLSIKTKDSNLLRLT